MANEWVTSVFEKRAKEFSMMKIRLLLIAKEVVQKKQRKESEQGFIINGEKDILLLKRKTLPQCEIFKTLVTGTM